MQNFYFRLTCVAQKRLCVNSPVKPTETTRRGFQAIFQFPNRYNSKLTNYSFFFKCTQQTFHYNSDLWSNKVDFNLQGGKTGLDTHETKLPTYWNTPFNKICLGMKIGQQFKSVVINHQARSLYSLIADGKYRASSLGRNTWKKLIGSRASLQPNCNKEGFNVLCTQSHHSKARIGIVGNEQNDCTSCDSRIGFGTEGFPDDSNTCGNEASSHAPDNGKQHIKAMGYILVQ